MNFATLLEMAADGFGERVAVGAASDGLTYQELRSLSAAAAARFAATGATNVAILADNGPVVPVAMFGAAWAGLAYAPVNHRLPAAAVTELLGRLEPVVVVADVASIEALAFEPSGGIVRAEDLLSSSDAQSSPRCQDVAPEDVAVRLFTSGTSSEPKAAILRHRHLTAYVLSTVEFASAGEDEAALLSVPAFHIAGVSGVLTSVYRGRRLVPLARFDAQLWLETVEAQQVTHALLVPTMLARIVEKLEPADPRVQSLRLLSYGGARMPSAVIERAMGLLPAATGFVNAYGLTETSSTIAVLGPEDHRQAFASDDPGVQARLRSVGRPVPSIEISIRSPAGDPLGPGEQGEIWVRGEQVSGEYEDAPGATDDAGWLRSGDEGWLDHEGYLFVAGRADDVIIRGGENISAAEVEDALLSHPDVRQAAIVGLHDDEWGERVAAAVVVRPGADVTEGDLIQWSRTQIGSFKSPEVLVIRHRLPETATGKIIRRAIRSDLDEAISGPGANEEQ